MNTTFFRASVLALLAGTFLVVTGQRTVGSLVGYLGLLVALLSLVSKEVTYGDRTASEE